MARSNRASRLITDNESLNMNHQLNEEPQSSDLTTKSDKQPKHVSQSEHICDQKSNLSNIQKPDQEYCLDKSKVIKTPPRPPRKTSLEASTPSPPVKQKARRNSDSVPFITAPARVPHVSRNSLASLYSVKPPDTCAQECQEWVTSPFFSADHIRVYHFSKKKAFCISTTLESS